MINITDEEFLKAIFGENTPFCHVTDFPYPPDNIPGGKQLIAWKGDYYSRYHFQPCTNRYFTISTFYCDDKQQARRRKSLYRETYCLVLDDVREKLSEEVAAKLPKPSWILETSKDSFQWGYIFVQPVTESAKIDNLNDGLIDSDLAPSGKDPGQRGITRYVKLPSSINNKTTKLNDDGSAFVSKLHLWEPFNRVTIEQLAAPFMIDLNRVRREARTDGAAIVSDHPLLQIPNIIKIKEVRSDGRFDITCPWVNEHTGDDDSGSAVFTNADGSIGFKCHHGSCQERTGRDLLQFIDTNQPGFTKQFKNWQILHEFKTIVEPSFLAPVISQPVQNIEPVTFLSNESSIDGLQLLCDNLRREHPTSNEARTLAANILKHADDLPKLDKMQWHDQVCDLMSWGKGDFKDILKDLRQQWYGEKINDAAFYNDIVFVKELNQFYDYKSRIFFTTDAFQNSFSHEDVDVKKIALQENRVKKVDKLDYAPKKPRVFSENGSTYANSWSEDSQFNGVKGDVQRWFDHFEALGWDENRKHFIQWMAHTMRHPDIKINHMLLLGGGEGIGKDYLLYPLTKAMGENYEVISGEELLSGFNDYVLSTKYLHINEAELGDRREAVAVSNKLKPLAAAPPDTFRVNQKGIKPIKIRNIVSVSMTTNSMLPVRLNGPSRRIYGLWSELNPRDINDNMKPEWVEYWKDRWGWMLKDGWKNVAHYLMYEVDLSDFNPHSAPAVTDFLRDIREASKSPMLQTIEIFIKKKIGTFECDLLTSADMAETLKAGGIFAPNEMYAKAELFTPIRVGMMMKQDGRIRQLTSYNLGREIKLWVFRNFEKYNAMDSTSLFHEYVRQVDVIRGKSPLREVK